MYPDKKHQKSPFLFEYNASLTGVDFKCYIVTYLQCKERISEQGS